MKKHRTIITISIIVLAILIYIQIPKYDKEEIEKFELYKNDFEFITEYIIQNFDSENDSVLVFYEPDGSVYLYNEGENYLSKELQNAFNSISDAFENYDFSFVDITQGRISFAGLGYRMYVYSRNGKVPRYYYFDDDGMHPDIYSLGDNWYLLTVNYR